MRLDELPRSDKVEDRRGSGPCNKQLKASRADRRRDARPDVKQKLIMTLG